MKRVPGSQRGDDQITVQDSGGSDAHRTDDVTCVTHQLTDITSGDLDNSWSIDQLIGPLSPVFWLKPSTGVTGAELLFLSSTTFPYFTIQKVSTTKIISYSTFAVFLH